MMMNPASSSSQSPSRPSRRDADITEGVSVVKKGPVATVLLHRPSRRNCVDGPTAYSLYSAFRSLETDASVLAIVLYGAGGHFCAGADLQALSGVEQRELEEAERGGPPPKMMNPLMQVKPVPVGEDAHCVAVKAHTEDIGPMGISRLVLTKPTIAAIAGFAVAGGLELACWADMRVAERSSTFGVYCRRFGVPLIDGGTVRLPRLIGGSRAADMILTGRSVEAKEAFEWGLVNRLVEDGQAREAAEALALSLCQFPQLCLRVDRWSSIHQHSKPLRLALEHESAHAMQIVKAESIAGAKRFKAGQGKHGNFQEKPKNAAATQTSSTASELKLNMLLASAAPASSAPTQPVSPAFPTAFPKCGIVQNLISASTPAPNNGIRVVLFDLGGVVVDSPVARILAYESSLGLPKHSINLFLGKSGSFYALERGEIDLQTFAKRLDQEIKEQHPSLPEKYSTRALFDLMGQVRPRAPMLASIAKLRAAGIVCGAVTNNWVEKLSDERGIMMHALEGIFDFEIESAKVGARKPEAKIFDMALKRANEILREKNHHAAGSAHSELKPSQCAFLDDLGVNLKAAQQLGIHTIKVTSDYHRAIEQLQQRTGVPLAYAPSPQQQQIQAKL